MRFLALIEILTLHRLVVEQSGGSLGLRDLGSLQSAVAQPRMTFNGLELYPTIIEKAAALGFSLVANHPFIDGNKRVAHAAMESFLILNGFEISSDVNEQEAMMLALAAGDQTRDELVHWLQQHVRKH